MKSVKITGPRQSTLLDIPEPNPRDNWVKVKITVAPMCTEFKGFLDGTGENGYGHEAVGVVVEIAQSCRVKKGDRVVVQPGTSCGVCDLCLSGDYIHCEHMVDYEAFIGTSSGRWMMCQYTVKPDWLLSPIPSDVNDEMAALAICGLGPTFEALDAMNTQAYDTVLVSGLGPVGLGGIVNARFRGARVIGVESNPYRAALGRELGAVEIVDPASPRALEQISALTGGRGVDQAVECAGIPASQRLCIDATRRKGHVAYVGWCTQPSSYTANVDLIMKGLRFHGIWHYNLASFSRVIQVIRESPVVGKMITHVYPIGDIQKAWETQASGQCGKVMLKPWD